MNARYSNNQITGLWSLETKFALWQKVELAVIKARQQLKRIPEGTYESASNLLTQHPIDIAKIDEFEATLHHDLNAFLEERFRFLPLELQAEFHQGMTSYDTEESAFVLTLERSCQVVFSEMAILFDALKTLALDYRYTPMNERTHGQEAEMQSFGKRCLSWYTDLVTAHEALVALMPNLEQSKLSGAIGTNSTLDPELETAALKILDLEPRIGVTQIMPRVLYAPIANALSHLVLTIDKVAGDIRLGARSGRPLWHEPFGKGQKGSSAMPHKKNPILTEKIGGMARMAHCYAIGLVENIKTWEARDISQSSVERVFWPDLFHVTLHAIKTMTRVISGLVVYPDNMLIEIIELRGCYASNKAKEVLTELGLPFGLARNEAYRLVQLACFNAFEPEQWQIRSRKPIEYLVSADNHLENMLQHGGMPFSDLANIQEIIANGWLRVSSELACTQTEVNAFNEKVKQIFSLDQQANFEAWDKIFEPSTILASEDHLFKEAFLLVE